MKKLISIVLVLILCGTIALSEGMLAGGWTLRDLTEPMTEEEVALFEKAFEGFVGVGYEPVAILSTQVVAGMNYCFLCRATTVTAQPVTYWAYVYIYADLEGNAEVSYIGAIEKGE